ncbi:hypothetical protein L6452_31209 [Arctium lappa]|uniref:Uncharacterized protein n=1 Tax=Arctium lappa TaxID=4217 RepID=A0ACB8ZKL4_ARCLA|nr:hypothetical protein L6452_31209 [Arctium lappa]
MLLSSVTSKCWEKMRAAVRDAFDFVKLNKVYHWMETMGLLPKNKSFDKKYHQRSFDNEYGMIKEGQIVKLSNGERLDVLVIGAIKGVVQEVRAIVNRGSRGVVQE